MGDILGLKLVGGLGMRLWGHPGNEASRRSRNETGGHPGNEAIRSRNETALHIVIHSAEAKKYII